MAIDIWKIEYRILKVNKTPYIKKPDMIREYRENMPGAMKKAAETLADRFDFGLVEVVGKSVNTGEEFKFLFESDDGYRDAWTVGKQ